MKHYLPFLLIISLFLPSLACNALSMNHIQGSGKIVTQEVNVSNFDSVSLEGSGDVYIQQGQTESLTVEADDNIMPVLINKVVGNQLVLTTKPNQSLEPSQKVVYRITVKDLTGLSLKGSGNFFVSPVKSNSMDISLNGSGDINMDDLATSKLSVDLNGSGNVSIDKLATTSNDVTVNGSGDVKLAGQADSQNVTYSGSGKYLAGDLETNSADIRVPGSADLTVWVKEKLNVSINGSGTVSYYGTPTVSQTGQGSGKLNSLGAK